MRFYFYILSGIVSALLGWGASQPLLLGGKNGQEFGKGLLPLDEQFLPDLIMLPLVSICVAVVMVITEILLSNPTRFKANRRILLPYAFAALGMGLLSSFIAVVILWLCYQAKFSGLEIRMITWSTVGLLVGFGEGLSWRFRNIAGVRRRANQRIIKSTVFGAMAGFTSAISLEYCRPLLNFAKELDGNMIKPYQGYEDPLGFLLLGSFIGLSLCFASAPTYLVALRAGAGFDATDPERRSDSRKRLPRINHPSLRFVTGHYDYIEEGLSIELPPTSRELIIGSDRTAHIYLPNIPAQAAKIIIKRRNVKLKSLTERKIKVQEKELVKNSHPVSLSHNQILTFYRLDRPEKYYRFVFYDRCLDPES